VNEFKALTDGSVTRTGFALKYEVGPGIYCRSTCYLMVSGPLKFTQHLVTAPAHNRAW